MVDESRLVAVEHAIQAEGEELVAVGFLDQHLALSVTGGL